jgi:hypothetical protein
MVAIFECCNRERWLRSRIATFEKIIQSEKSPCQNHYNRRHNRASPLSQTAEPEFHPLGTWRNREWRFGTEFRSSSASKT